MGEKEERGRKGGSIGLDRRRTERKGKKGPLLEGKTNKAGLALDSSGQGRCHGEETNKEGLGMDNPTLHPTQPWNPS